jgi:hypothetical protein
VQSLKLVLFLFVNSTTPVLRVNNYFQAYIDFLSFFGGDLSGLFFVTFGYQKNLHHTKNQLNPFCCHIDFVYDWAFTKLQGPNQPNMH